MTAIMSIDEPRPRGTVFGERADRRRVSEAEHYFRCKICGGYFDARDLVFGSRTTRRPSRAASVVRFCRRLGLQANEPQTEALGLLRSGDPRVGLSALVALAN